MTDQVCFSGQRAHFTRRHSWRRWQLSAPDESWGAQATLPQFFEMQRLHGCRRDLEYCLASVEDDLGRDVHQPAAKRCGECCDWHHWLAHVFLERLEQEEAEKHGVVEGGVGDETLERQLFEAELLENPVHQLVRPALVVRVNDGVGFDHKLKPGVTQLLVDASTHAEIGVGECAWPRSGRRNCFSSSKGRQKMTRRKRSQDWRRSQNSQH